MDMDALPPTLSVEQAAEVLGLSRSSAYRAAATGELPTLRFGRRLVVPTRRLREMLGYGGKAEPARVSGEGSERERRAQPPERATTRG